MSGLIALVAAAAAALAAAGPGTARAAVPAGNLLQDPGAEQAGGGLYIFTGGNSALATVTQRVDVSAGADRIDAGHVLGQLTAQLGGFASENDHMDVTVSYLGAVGNVLGKFTVAGPRGDARKAQTVMVLSKGTTNVPAGTRAIEVVLTSTRENGSWNDGDADNLSLVLADQGAGGTTTAAASDSSGTVPAATVAGNLVTNPGAEQFANGQLPGRALKDGFTALAYGAPGGFPGPDVAKALGGGASFFTGGNSTRSTATQVIGLASQATAIDRGTLTTLLPGAAALKVPPGTRAMTIAIVAVSGSGAWNDGDIDNIALTLGTAGR